jgi:hypothetical protein
MMSLPSSLENAVERFDRVRDVCRQCGFTVGGNWDYDHGTLDRPLDEANEVWLRIPFSVIRGRFDPDAGSSDCTVKLGRPYVLRHLYRQGIDRSGDIGVMSALVDQFQEPVDPDATVDDHWLEAAKAVLNEVESRFA